MFRKLTTIIDSRLLKAMEKDPTLSGLRGFHECLELTTTVVGVGIDNSPHTQLRIMKEWDKYALVEDPGLAGNKRRIAHLIDPCTAEGGWLRTALHKSSRIEIVIKFSPYGANHFLWSLYTYSTSGKEPFFRVSFNVSFDGHVSGAPMSLGEPGSIVQKI